MIGFQLTDDRLDGRTATQLALDALYHAPPLLRDEDPEFVAFWRVVAAIAAVGVDALRRLRRKRTARLCP
jgi:hypothetical protein